ncbi:MAG: response regulator [Clostridia bacterium]|nr:response regulator [Clostridia bacterium]
MNETQVLKPWVVMVVDDDNMNLRRAEVVLKKQGYSVVKAASGMECLELLKTTFVDLILLDILMPEMNGFEVMAQLQSDSKTKEIPVIYLTADNTPEVEIQCFKSGAMDFVVKPFVNDVLAQRVWRILELKRLQNEMSNYNARLEKEVEIQTANVVKMHNKLILGMAEMVEGRDPNTGGHIKRTSAVIQIFATHLEKHSNMFEAGFLKKLVKAAPLHDLGKITIDDAILRKPGKFTVEEFDCMKSHAANGGEVLNKIFDEEDDPQFYKIALNIAKYHHEKYDGSGYPCGLKGDEIPLEARIMALADVFDALIRKRCYKESFPFDIAFNIINDSKGSHFDPVLTEMFEECREELETYYSKI